MQQAIYNSSITSNGITIQAATTNKTSTRRTSLARRLARRWDMVGVLVLMTSSAAYGVFALAHLGL